MHSESGLTRTGRWGFAGPWYGELLAGEADPLLGRMKLLKRYGFSVFSIGLDQLWEWEERQRQRVWDFLDETGMALAVYAGYPYITADEEEIRTNNERILRRLSELPAAHTPAIVMTGARYTSRFDRRFPLPEALERLSAAIAPLAAGCSRLGTRLGIENHGDFYCSDLAGVCRETPELYLFLDTGNTYLIGERPLEAFREAAPYVIGTHFKDHKVRPVLDADPLHFEVGPSALGEGDVPLRDCYDLLLERAPFPDELIMEIEMICPHGESPFACLERSLAYIRTLDGERA